MRKDFWTPAEEIRVIQHYCALPIRRSFFCLIGNCYAFPIKQKRSAKDAHSRDRNVLHKCNRAWRENVASNILSCFILAIRSC